MLDNGNGVEEDRLTEISENIGEKGGSNIGLKMFIVVCIFTITERRILFYKIEKKAVLSLK
ncbi:hypothetical protein ACI2OX_01375 [Bacillus sp. N9]